MAYDLIINSPTNIALGAESYSLREIPSFNSTMVQKEVSQVLGQLNLGEVTENLELSIDLLNVAYHGVAGQGSLRPRVAKLQSDLGLLSNDCIVTMTSFESQTSIIIKQLIEVHKWLSKTKESMALKKLQRCKEASKRMAVEAKQLADAFVVLQKESTTVYTDTMYAEEQEHARKVKLEESISTLDAKLTAQKKNQEELVASAMQAELDYQDAKDREESEIKHTRTVQIVGMVLSVFKAGLGAVLNEKSEESDTIKAQREKHAQAQLDANDKQAQLLEDETLANEAAQHREQLQTQFDQAAQKLDALEQKLESKRKQPDAQEEVEALLEQYKAQQAEKVKLEVQLEQASKEESKAKQTAEKSKRIYDTAYKALEGIEASLKQMTAASEKTLTSYRQEKMAFLKQKIELEKAKRESLEKLSEFTSMLANSKDNFAISESSVQSLHAAVGAMGQIVSSLTQAALFWEQMANYCDRMQDAGFQAMIEDVKDEDEETRQEQYEDEAFIEEYLVYICQWTALNYISKEYKDKANAAQQKAMAHLKQNPSIELCRQLAPELAKEMGNKLSRQIESSNETLVRLRTSSEQTQALLPSDADLYQQVI
ncbi:hypothetical protein PA25_22960 [Pseudoalteromonas sp. A25]|uniref:hypothetical protein n=1 Tax=Pseudoalteromonas sp. A25 TaxID=116092 RepID=UPI0012605F72|nr:hypothetical protein [Pseudoalteromonas sp. A25]BBN82311.1 hypothetical protein PA25_22960 [Pseudoalteromonas sp. A25]